MSKNASLCMKKKLNFYNVLICCIVYLTSCAFFLDISKTWPPLQRVVSDFSLGNRKIASNHRINQSTITDHWNRTSSDQRQSIVQTFKSYCTRHTSTCKVCNFQTFLVWILTRNSTKRASKLSPIEKVCLRQKQIPRRLS